MLNIFLFVHLLSVVIWVGSIMFFSFCAAPAIFKVLEREKAGEVIGVIFPRYWLVGYVCGIVGVLSLILIAAYGGGFLPLRFILVLLMMVLGFYSGLVVGRKAREIKSDIKASTDDAEKERLRGRFKKVHAKSAILNMVTLAIGIVVVYLIAITL
ncbi:hypothetical protein MNBD_DELTA01-1817 [hydrothermal vent metagenome]|uniref:TMEM205-like domain-containing protein n=1 Tax=hydrothermal vent metagenome TaxID=652676 RepID=A0A3B0QYR0_9ZZZZ